jgi:hypothetical protein
MVTPGPLYVIGNYNCTNAAALGTTNTLTAFPCALISDALTILSSSWRDSQSSSNFTMRVAANTTVNAAILTGNVPSTGSSSLTYSGGIQNLPRLLEDWTGKTLTLNTSFVRLFASTHATNQFQNPGLYYISPARHYSLDQNFLNPTKLPPGTPILRVPPDSVP